MLLYWIPTENRYVRTQGEAKKLGFGDATDIPLDKDGLLAWLNDLRRELSERSNPDTGYVDDTPPTPTLADTIAVTSGAMDEPPPHTPCPDCPKCPEWAMDASAVIARMDNPGGKIDEVIEVIAKMRGGHALKRVAGAVAMRFEELSK